MDIKAFECIMKVAEKESISKAAEELFVSQSHLSRIVRKVESQIGIKIFERSNKGVEVT